MLQALEAVDKDGFRLLIDERADSWTVELSSYRLVTTPN